MDRLTVMKTLVAVARVKSFNGAARSLGIPEPALRVKPYVARRPSPKPYACALAIENSPPLTPRRKGHAERGQVGRLRTGGRMWSEPGGKRLSARQGVDRRSQP